MSKKCVGTGHVAGTPINVLILVTILLGSLMLPGPAGAQEETYYCGDKPATIVGTEGDDVLRATGRGDVIVGLGGDDEIGSRRGHVMMCGDAGDDVLKTAGKDNELHGGEGRDLLVRMPGPYEGSTALHDGGPGRDVLDFSHAITDDNFIPDEGYYGSTHVDLAAGIALVEYDAQGAGANDIVVSVESVVGSRYLDYLTGDEESNVLIGGDWPDYVRGGGGDDKLRGQGSQDHLYGGPGNDNLSGGSDADELRGSEGSDFLFGKSGPDRLNGGPGRNSNDGGHGEDRCVNPDSDHGASNCERP
jgi:Ca2+-binding RTX toxin-like protein